MGKPSFSALLQEAEAPPEPRPPKPEASTDLIPDSRTAAQLAREQFAWHVLFGKEPFNLKAAYLATFPDKVGLKTIHNQAHKFFADPYTKGVMAKLISEAKQRNQLDEDFVLGHWLAMADANIMDYFHVIEEGDREGHLILRSSDLNSMERIQQQNIRKLKVHNRTTTIVSKNDAEITTHEQTIELELIDRAAAVRNLAVFLGMMKGKEGLDIEDLGKAIREAEQRAVQRGRTFNGETGEVEDGELG